MNIQGLITYYFFFPKSSEALYFTEKPNKESNNRRNHYNRYGIIGYNKSRFNPIYGGDIIPFNKASEDTINNGLYLGVSEFLQAIAEPSAKLVKKVPRLTNPPQFTTPKSKNKDTTPTSNPPLITYTFSLIPRKVSRRTKDSVLDKYPEITKAHIDLRAYSLIVNGVTTTDTSIDTVTDTSTYKPTDAQLEQLNEDVQTWFRQLSLLDLIHHISDYTEFKDWPTLTIRFSSKTPPSAPLEYMVNYTVNTYVNNVPKSIEQDTYELAYHYVVNDAELSRAPLHEQSYYQYYPSYGTIVVNVSESSFMRVTTPTTSTDAHPDDTHEPTLFHYKHDPDADFLDTYQIAKLNPADPVPTALEDEAKAVNDELEDVTLTSKS